MTYNVLSVSVFLMGFFSSTTKPLYPTSPLSARWGYRLNSGDPVIKSKIIKSKLLGIIINFSKALNDLAGNILDTETTRPRNTPQAKQALERMQKMAVQGRNEVKMYKNELNNLQVTDDLMQVKARTNVHLDHWNELFNIWFRYSSSENKNDLDAATATYKMLESELGTINTFFAMGSFESRVESLKSSEPPTYTKEIIKEKEVIVKIRCEYCRNTYDEILDQCPHCGAKR